jgi:hypothetical protein
MSRNKNQFRSATYVRVKGQNQKKICLPLSSSICALPYCYQKMLFLLLRVNKCHYIIYLTKILRKDAMLLYFNKNQKLILPHKFLFNALILPKYDMLGGCLKIDVMQTATDNNFKSI